MRVVVRRGFREKRYKKSNKNCVISGVGTCHFYRKLGYELEGPNMVNSLVSQRGKEDVSSQVTTLGPGVKKRPAGFSGKTWTRR